MRVYVLIPGIAAVFSLPSLYAVLGTDFVSWVLRYVASDVTKVSKHSVSSLIIYAHVSTLEVLVTTIDALGHF